MFLLQAASNVCETCVLPGGVADVFQIERDAIAGDPFLAAGADQKEVHLPVIEAAEMFLIGAPVADGLVRVYRAPERAA